MAKQEMPLDREFFERPTAEVAIDLISMTLWRTTAQGCVSGRIVETEAYLDSRDHASHAAWSRRGRDVMQRAPGTIYIYRSYGMHWMLNIVAHAPGTVGAILLRAVEPVDGIELMEERRGTTKLQQLCSGPGKLCQAFGIDDSMHKTDLLESNQIGIEPDGVPDDIELVVGERIGITKSADLPLRFFEAGNRFVSAHRRGVPFDPAVLPSS